MYPFVCKLVVKTARYIRIPENVTLTTILKINKQ